MSIDSVDVIEVYRDHAGMIAADLRNLAADIVDAPGSSAIKAAVRALADRAIPDDGPGTTIYEWRHSSCETDDDGRCLECECEPEPATRASRYEQVQNDYPGDYSSQKYEGERFAAVQGSYRNPGMFWVYLSDDEGKALELAGLTEGDWSPHVLFDLETGASWTLGARTVKMGPA